MSSLINGVARMQKFLDNPVIFPSASTSILSAAGTFGSPGGHDISGQCYDESGPAEIFKFLTVTSKSVGAPSLVASSVKLY